MLFDKRLSMGGQRVVVVPRIAPDSTNLGQALIDYRAREAFKYHIFILEARIDESRENARKIDCAGTKKTTVVFIKVEISTFVTRQPDCRSASAATRPKIRDLRTRFTCPWQTRTHLKTPTCTASLST